MYKSNKQAKVQGTMFGTEFATMKVATEENRALRHKLRMMRVPIDGPSYMFSDNQSVLYSTIRPELILKKKSNSIAYHLVREVVAMGELLTGYVESRKNREWIRIRL